MPSGLALSLGGTRSLGQPAHPLPNSGTECFLCDSLWRMFRSRTVASSSPFHRCHTEAPRGRGRNVNIDSSPGGDKLQNPWNQVNLRRNRPGSYSCGSAPAPGLVWDVPICRMGIVILAVLGWCGDSGQHKLGPEACSRSWSCPEGHGQQLLHAVGSRGQEFWEKRGGTPKGSELGALLRPGQSRSTTP